MWLPVPRLRFPMKVDVKNPRLICLFFIVQVISFVLVSIMFWLLDMWAAKMPVGRFVYPTLAVNGLLYQERLQEVWADRSQKPFCTSPSFFDYHWDEEGLSAFSNHTCLPLCGANESPLHHKCVPLPDTYIAQNLDDVFITTQIQDTTLFEDGRVGAKQNYFIPTAEGLGVSLRFSYDVPIPPKLQLPAWTQSDFQQSKIYGSSTRDVVTVVLDASGHLWHKFLPGEDIQFSIPTLLQLAGDPGLLDTPQPHLGRNKLPGAALPDGPIARLTGFGLEFGLECFDKQYVTVPGHDGFQCLLRVNKFLPGWFAVEHSDLLDNEGRRRHRLSHGIRVSVRTGGDFRFFSLKGMLRYSTYMIVLMALPSKFVLFIAVSCLGHLSVVYKKVLFHDFDIYEKVGGFATRLMSSSAAFVLLDDTKGKGISKHRMHERLSSAASAHAVTVGPDKEVIQRFVDYCWHSAVKERNLRMSTLQEMMTSVHTEITEALKPRRKSKVDNIHLDLEHFSKACTNNEDIPFEVLVGMFSRHRKREFLERIFTPSNVSRYLISDEDDLMVDEDGDIESVASSMSAASNAIPPDPSANKTSEEAAGRTGSASEAATSFRDSVVTEAAAPVVTAARSKSKISRMSVAESVTTEVPVLVTRTKRRAMTLEQTKVELDSDHERIQALEASLSSLQGRMNKQLEDLDLRLSNLEGRVQDGLGSVESRARSLEKKAEQAAELMEKRHADVQEKLEKGHEDILEKLEGRFESYNQAVASMVAESVAEAMAESQPLLARLPDFEAQLRQLVLLYRQISPGVLGHGSEAAHPELNDPDEEVEMPQASTIGTIAHGLPHPRAVDQCLARAVIRHVQSRGAYAVEALDPYGYKRSHNEAWNTDPEVVPNGELAELQPVSYSAFVSMFNDSPCGSTHTAQARGGYEVGLPRASPRAAAQADGSPPAVEASAPGAPAQRADTGQQSSVPAHRGSVGLFRLGRALSPTTLRRLGP